MLSKPPDDLAIARQKLMSAWLDEPILNITKMNEAIAELHKLLIGGEKGPRYMRWTEEVKQALIALRSQGKSMKAVAIELKMSKGAVARQIKRLGLPTVLTPPPKEPSPPKPKKEKPPSAPKPIGDSSGYVVKTKATHRTGYAVGKQGCLWAGCTEKTIARGKPYCAAHMIMDYQKGSPMPNQIMTPSSAPTIPELESKKPLTSAKDLLTYIRHNILAASPDTLGNITVDTLGPAEWNIIALALNTYNREEPKDVDNEQKQE